MEGESESWIPSQVPAASLTGVACSLGWLCKGMPKPGSSLLCSLGKKILPHKNEGAIPTCIGTGMPAHPCCVLRMLGGSSSSADILPLPWSKPQPARWVSLDLHQQNVRCKSAWPGAAQSGPAQPKDGGLDMSQWPCSISVSPPIHSALPLRPLPASGMPLALPRARRAKVSAADRCRGTLQPVLLLVPALQPNPWH